MLLECHIIHSSVLLSLRHVLAAQLPGATFFGTAALVGVLSATIVEFNKVSPEAAQLMLPYLGWTTFAAVLTLDIWRKNPEVLMFSQTVVEHIYLAPATQHMISCLCLLDDWTHDLST